MGKLFNRNTDIIQQVPYNDGPRYSERKSILIPLIAHKVLVPYPDDRDLNLFQEAILKFFLSGNKPPAKIAEKMGLKEKLVEFIIEQLIANGFLTEEGLVTFEGKEALDLQTSLYEIKTGYIFYDLLGGYYWDSFVMNDDLTLQEYKPGRERNTRSIRYGDIGDPKFYNTFEIMPEKEEFPIPSPTKILEICVRHKIRRKNMKIMNFAGMDDTLQLPKNIEKVKYLDDYTPLYTAVYMYYPEDKYNKSNWQVSHPFHKGMSPRLRDILDTMMYKDEYLYIQRLLKDMTLAVFGKESVEIEDIYREINKEAVDYVVNVLSEKIKDYSKIFIKLTDIYTLVKELSRDSNKGNLYEENQKRIKEFLELAYQTIEQSMYYLKKEYEDYYNTSILTRSPYQNSKNLSILADECGFIDNKEEKLFERFFYLKKGHFTYVDKNQEMRALIGVNLLIAREFQGHPFWKLGQTVPQFIEFLAELKNKRDSYSHDSEEIINYSQINDIFPKVLYLISLLIPELSFNFNYLEDTDFNSINTNFHKIAERNIESNFGIEIRDFIGIRDKLIEIETDRLLSEKLSDRDKKAVNTNNTIVNCALLLEKVYSLLRKIVLRREAISEVDKGIKYLSKKMIDYGFDFELDKLPDSFKNVHPGKVKSTFTNYDRGVLSAKLYVLLYSAAVEDNKVIRDIAAKIPEFISFSAEVNDRRGHGNKALAQREMSDIIKKLYSVLQKMMVVFKENNISTKEGA